jgi:hypothetical protein
MNGSPAANLLLAKGAGALVMAPNEEIECSGATPDALARKTIKSRVV